MGSTPPTFFLKEAVYNNYSNLYLFIFRLVPSIGEKGSVNIKRIMIDDTVETKTRISVSGDR